MVKDGKEVVYVQEGLADRETGRKIERDTIFPFVFSDEAGDLRSCHDF